ncbi:MAG: ComEC/Rec2 family competence protein [candidate division WOR-3 bacterium]|nr:ComEC/Rec2 family competence protein [candidate division WOR-3 bacterium]MDW8150532.1 ComEC/Rec2 family competence protein [candidate division WOR-3 bacterium]
MYLYHIFFISISFAIGLFLPLKLTFIFLAISLIFLKFFKPLIYIPFMFLGSLRMEIYKYPNVKPDYPIRIEVNVPSKGILPIEGSGIYKSNLYPADYVVSGYIRKDSFIVLDFEKLKNENPVYEFFDNLLRDKTFSFKDYAIISAFILNNREFIPYEIKNAFIETGMFHILAISGLHISLIFLVISFILSIFYIPKKLNFIISSIIVFLYTAMLDFIPSCFRAFLFALIFSIAYLFERKVNMLNVFGFALLINLLINPVEIYDVGFQLSYLAVLGLIYSPFKYDNNYILNIIKGSISAQIFTIPILLYHFSKAPILYFFGNIITIPISTLLLVNVVFCIIFPFIEQLWMSLHLLNLVFIHSVVLLEKFNLPALKFKLNTFGVFLYLVLVFLLISLWKKDSLLWNLQKR